MERGSGRGERWVTGEEGEGSGGREGESGRNLGHSNFFKNYFLFYLTQNIKKKKKFIINLLG